MALVAPVGKPDASHADVAVGADNRHIRIELAGHLELDIAGHFPAVQGPSAQEISVAVATRTDEVLVDERLRTREPFDEGARIVEEGFGPPVVAPDELSGDSRIVRQATPLARHLIPLEVLVTVGCLGRFQGRRHAAHGPTHDGRVIVSLTTEVVPELAANFGQGITGEVRVQVKAVSGGVAKDSPRAVDFGVVAPVLEQLPPVLDVADEVVAQFPKNALSDHPRREGSQRTKSVRVSNAEEDLFVLGCLVHFHRVTFRRGHGLFLVNVHSKCDRAFRDLLVQMVWRAVDDEVQSLVTAQFSFSIEERVYVTVRSVAGSVLVLQGSDIIGYVADGHELSAMLVKSQNVGCRDSPAADHSVTKKFLSHRDVLS